MKNSEQPIYPIIIEQATSRYATVPDTILECKSSGLTKREYFAAMAMQGYLASYGPTEPANSQHVAEKAVECADALLTELEKSNQ